MVIQNRVKPNGEKSQKQLAYNDEVLDKIRVKPGELPCKVFEPRNSPLTDLWEVKHIRAIYHICIAALIGLLINTAACDFLKDGKSKLGLNLMIKGFVRIDIFIFIWTCMFVTSIGIYFGFKYWATFRFQLIHKSIKTKIWDNFCLGFYILFYPTFLYFSTLAVINYELSLLLSLAALMEMTRIIMKTHAFVRSNAPKVLNYKLSSSDQNACPEFSRFIYFSIAPTLVYQDKYPRTKHIRWNYVGSCTMEFIATLFFLSFLLERFFIPSFENYGKQFYSWKDIVIRTLEHGVPAMLFALVMFYLLLHLWMNCYAEMLRFSDRLFYKDWWVSTNYARYYRTWNVVVHDWLYTYVYKDFYEIVVPKNKIAAKYMVFFMSALFHEYILGFAFRFYIPILFLELFVVGTLLSFFKIKQGSVGNIFLWYSMACGTGINFSFYLMEYYSRQNCPIEIVTVSSYFIPQLFTCNNTS